MTISFLSYIEDKTFSPISRLKQNKFGQLRKGGQKAFIFFLKKKAQHSQELKMPFFLYKKMKNVFTIDTTPGPPSSIWTAAPKRVRSKRKKPMGVKKKKTTNSGVVALGQAQVIHFAAFFRLCDNGYQLNLLLPAHSPAVVLKQN